MILIAITPVQLTVIGSFVWKTVRPSLGKTVRPVWYIMTFHYAEPLIAKFHFGAVICMGVMPIRFIRSKTHMKWHIPVLVFYLQVGLEFRPPMYTKNLENLAFGIHPLKTWST